MTLMDENIEGSTLGGTMRAITSTLSKLTPKDRDQIERALTTGESGQRIVRVRVEIGEPGYGAPVYGETHVVFGVSVEGYENTPRDHAKLLRLLADMVDPDREHLRRDITGEPF